LERLRRLKPPIPQGVVKDLDIAGLVRLTRSGDGVVAIVEPGLSSSDMAELETAIRAALPGLGALALLPDNRRGGIREIEVVKDYVDHKEIERYALKGTGL